MCEPASRSRFLRAAVFFSYLSIFSPFFIMTVFGSSLESIWRWKSEKILNKQTIAWKVLCTLFTHRSISVGSSNIFAASKNFRYTGSITRVKKRPTRNIHIATQSSDCSWENQEFIHFATSFYQYPISICLKIDETHIRPAVLFREKEILTGKFSSLFDVFGRFYRSVRITCSRGSNLWR